MTISASDTLPLLPAWELFAHDYVENGVPYLYVVRSDPRVEVFVDQQSVRLGARLALPAATVLPASPLDEVLVANVLVNGVHTLEISTTSRLLYRNFYFLIADIISSVVLDSVLPLAALEQSLLRWQALLSVSDLLTEERQVGLFGELWMFRRLLPTLGAATTDAWTGPSAQAHDFRIGTNEFEVKSTSGSGPMHVISGLDQLVPSIGCRLFILSLQITHAGTGGITLAEAITATGEALRPWSGAEDRFLYLLAGLGYKPTDAVRYPRRRKLRGQGLLVPVIDGCPRLIPDALAALPAIYEPSRIRRAVYDIDLQGLGFHDGDPRFLQLLPATPQNRSGTSP